MDPERRLDGSRTAPWNRPLTRDRRLVSALCLPSEDDVDEIDAAPTKMTTGTPKQVTGLCCPVLVRRADFDTLHACLGFRTGLVDGAGRADDRRCRVDRLFIDDGALLRFRVLHHIVLVSRKCRSNECRDQGRSGNSLKMHVVLLQLIAAYPRAATTCRR
jgi:hypothetical protein